MPDDPKRIYTNKSATAIIAPPAIPLHPTDVEWVRSDLVDTLLALADELLEWLEGAIEEGCPKCGGDCSSANPPSIYCPMQDMAQDRARYKAMKDNIIRDKIQRLA